MDIAQKSAAQAEVRNALSVIEGVRLPHPLGVLLSSFVKEAMNPVLAARYVLTRNSEGGLQELSSDWIDVVQCSESP
jgi:hypothetical protein